MAGPRTQRTVVGVARFFTAVAAALLLAARAAPAPEPAATAEAPWNVVLFLADDLAWNQVGYHGTTFYETPTIDAVAEVSALVAKGLAPAGCLGAAEWRYVKRIIKELDAV